VSRFDPRRGAVEDETLEQPSAGLADFGTGTVFRFPVIPEGIEGVTRR
jgi:hypothetical protein